jgi:chromosome partitioning protein
VAPVILHHRVDFAASMVDGRTVGEAAPKSHSAREMRELWLYVQDRLSRLTRDARLAPEEKPLHLAVTALSALAEDALPPEPMPEPVLETAPASPMPSPIYDGPERRSGLDRRDGGHGFFGAAERRIHPFGRRAADRVFGKSSQKLEAT